MEYRMNNAGCNYSKVIFCVLRKVEVRKYLKNPNQEKYEFLRQKSTTQS